MHVYIRVNISMHMYTRERKKNILVFNEVNALNLHSVYFMYSIAVVSCHIKCI